MTSMTVPGFGVGYTICLYVQRCKVSKDTCIAQPQWCFILIVALKWHLMPSRRVTTLNSVKHGQDLKLMEILIGNWHKTCTRIDISIEFSTAILLTPKILV